jgi:hypothetical protein
MLCYDYIKVDRKGIKNLFWSIFIELVTTVRRRERDAKVVCTETEVEMNSHLCPPN